ncbi:MAG TPA: hypothetical protein VMZ22_11400 [Acidimicrobiales bacterium]|nr:hypothetical protein [Acidimicrobiales bacterium]
MFGDDLRATTLAWSAQWWDYDLHMVWNPAGGLAPSLAARSLHLVPNTAWLAYALLGQSDERDHAEAIAALEQLVALQYDAPGEKFHGTYAQFFESPYPSADAAMWIHYDPNWRQFVGTTFALILIDFADRIPATLVERLEASVRLACEGEASEARLVPTYANPALMCAWLDAWLGDRQSDAAALVRGEALARAVVSEHDRHGAFEEFNSPTYYGIDLYALRLWRLFPPTEYFAQAGRRLETTLWAQAARFFHAGLRNFCGPYTRSYHPDANRSVALFSLWQWALFGRERAPLPSLTDDIVDHCHDLCAGPLFARLAGPPDDVDLEAFREFDAARLLTQELPNRRAISAALHGDVMIGAEASDNDWGGWSQFMPVTVHWRDGVLWLINPHVVHARVSERTVTIDGVTGDLTCAVIASSCELTDAGFRAPGLECTVRGATVTSRQARDRYVLTLAPKGPALELAF